MIRKTYFSLFVLVVTLVCASSQAGIFWKPKAARKKQPPRPQTKPYFHPTYGYYRTQWRRFPESGDVMENAESTEDSEISQPNAYEPDETDIPMPPAVPAAPVTPAKPVTPAPPAKPATPVEPVAPARPAEPVAPASPAAPASPLPPQARLPPQAQSKSSHRLISRKQRPQTKRRLR